jgi:outer membrane protein
MISSRLTAVFTAAVIALSAASAMAQQQQQRPAGQGTAPAGQRPAAGAAPATGSPVSQLPPPLPPGQQLPPAVVGIVDLQIILRESSAAKSVREQVDAKRNSYQGEIQKRETDLRTAQQTLEQQAPVLSPDALNTRRQQFQTQAMDAQRFVDARLRQLEEAFNESMKQVEAATAQVLAEIAQARGINLVVPRQGVFLSANELDITSEVLGQVERKISRVNVNFPPLRNN